MSAPAGGRIAFARINDVGLGVAEAVVRGLLPDGHRAGAEWKAINPLRNDHRRGSFSVNLITGKWADFATGDRGKDLISLVAFVTGVSQRAAAIHLAECLGITPYV